MAATERNWYDTPLYYDIVFDPGTSTEADFIEAAKVRYGNPAARKRRPRLLEPACGSGRLIQEMTNRGWEAAGFDLSAESIAFARDRMARADRKARLWVDRMESFKVSGRTGFELAHCLVSTFKYLPTEADARSHLRLVGDCLRPGGLYLLGIHLTDYSRTRPEHERWEAKRSGVQVVCNTRTFPPDSARRTESLRCRLRITEKGKTHLQETHWQFRTYNARQLKQTLRAALPDFTVAACHDFHHDIKTERTFDDSYSDIVVVLRKNG